jgi:hypothetical protein
MGGKTYIDSRAQKREEIEFLDESNVRASTSRATTLNSISLASLAIKLWRINTKGE